MGIQGDFVFIIRLVLSELGYDGERRKKLAEDGVQFMALILFWFCCTRRVRKVKIQRS